MLVRDLIGPYAEEIRALADSPDGIAKASLLWRITYAIVEQMAEQLPQQLCWRRYEDLATNPVDGFRDLYQQCDLGWTDRAAEGILASCTGAGSAAAGFGWTLRGGLSRTAFRTMDSRASLASYRDRLKPETIERVQELTADVARRFYPAHEING